MTVKTAFRFFNYLRRAKKQWRKPPRAEVLVYDRIGADALFEYIDCGRAHIMDVRGETINLPALAAMIRNRKVSLADYEDSYIKFVQPKFVITFIDNNPNFYLVSKNNPSCITLFVQNGYRSEYTDVFSYLKVHVGKKDSWQVDHMLVFGDAVRGKFEEYVAGSLLNIGSFKNNMNPVTAGHINRNRVTFISQFRNHPTGKNATMMHNGALHITWDMFYTPERQYLPLLLAFCRERKLELSICGCSLAEQEAEKAYFTGIMGNEGWDFIPRKQAFNSYEVLDRSEFVFFIDTTLGYESLARGRKTVALSARTNIINSPGHGFGWPLDIPSSGPFWTNTLSDTELYRLADFITTVSDEEWERISKPIVSRLIEYDPGNARFVKLMNEIEMPLRATPQVTTSNAVNVI